jgi:hypothetical protein
LEEGEDMLTAQHVRIDAQLAPVAAPMPAALTALRWDFTSGNFDHMTSKELDAVSREIDRETLLVTARFNDHLNSLLAQYGLHVVQVSDPADQCAVAYGVDYNMSEALEQALAMRDWFLPAARHTWVPVLEDFPRPR